MCLMIKWEWMRHVPGGLRKARILCLYCFLMLPIPVTSLLPLIKYSQFEDTAHHSREFQTAGAWSSWPHWTHNPGINNLILHWLSPLYSLWPKLCLLRLRHPISIILIREIPSWRAQRLPKCRQPLSGMPRAIVLRAFGDLVKLSIN